MSENKPVISNRDKLLSASVFTQKIMDERGTHTAYSISLQRAYQTAEQKGSKEYSRQKISMYPEEALRMAALLVRTYNDAIAYAQSVKSENSGSYPASTMDVEDAPAPVMDDEIPF